MGFINEIFEFSENNVKRGVLQKNELPKKIKKCFNHFFENKRIPINELENDNSFDFSKLKFREGKNYDWFFLTNDKVTILVRQYGTHFTFFTNLKKEAAERYFSKVNVFIIHVDQDKINDDTLSDSLCDDNFLILSELLPSLVKILLEDDVHSLWNNLSFKRPDYVEVKNVYNGGEDVNNLDMFLFACDEIFQTFLECYAENEMLEKIKTFKVGDTFGEDYTILEVRTEVKNDYYHSVGLKYSRVNFTGKVEEKWDDVYALTRWHYKDFEYNPMVEEIKKFAYANYEKIFNAMVETSQVWGFIFVSHFVEALHKEFNKDIGVVEFRKLLPKKFETFIEQLYYIKKSIK